ncbi:MAG: mobile mystery protein A [Deltaproteobacteria bacterium]|nr:mobile mystery protein A [Deltaproteobacteria bacterium]
MKTNKKNLFNQRRIIEKRLRPWLALRQEQVPQSGWIKAIRGALGINTRQLAQMLGVAQATLVMLEKREAQGKATLELIQKAAQAMNCKLVYALVPSEPFNDLDSIVSTKARALAADLLRKIEHSMCLEKQGGDAADSENQIDRLVIELKSKMDSRIWEPR